MTTSEATKNKAVRAATQTASVNQPSNHSKIKPHNQALRGMQGYEFLKRAFTEANPNCSCSDYDQACYRFSRMAGV